MPITFNQYYGKPYDKITGSLPQRLTDNFTFNSPTGVVVDHFDNIWVCDTGNNRLVIFDNDLKTIKATYGSLEDSTAFSMPFRVDLHPSKPWMYVTDIGHHRVHILEYDAQLNITPIADFGGSGPEKLYGPNGVAVAEIAGNIRVFVADEFYPGTNDTSRVVVYDEMGNFVRNIFEVQSSTNIPLLWPQGISVGSDGLLYIANTGFAEVVRCDEHGNGVNFSETGSPKLGGFKIPRGCTVIEDTLYVPDSTTSMVHTFDLNGKQTGQIVGFLAPIQVSAHKDDTILVANPITPNVVIAKVWDFDLGFYQDAIELQIAGGARNHPGQFHFVANAFEMDMPEPVSPVDDGNDNHDTWLETWWEMWQNAWTWPLQYWESMFQPVNRYGNFMWNNDPGNYQIQRWSKDQNTIDSPQFMLAPPLVGGLCMATYTPKLPIPGQLAPGTPLFFVTNFYSGMVLIYQYNPWLNRLVFFSYFGGLGTGDGDMHEPLGIAINQTSGEIYVADSMNDRITQWEMNEFGLVEWKGSFGKEGSADGEFQTPTDVAIDGDGHLYVADQFNNRIQCLDSQGNFIGKFGTAGYNTQGDEFMLPTSVAVHNQHIFVNDLVNRAIKIFDKNGNFVESFAGLGGDPNSGDLWMPFFINATDSQVFAPDCTLNRVNVYDYVVAPVTTAKTTTISKPKTTAKKPATAKKASSTSSSIKAAGTATAKATTKPAGAKTTTAKKAPVKKAGAAAKAPVKKVTTRKAPAKKAPTKATTKE